MKECNHFFGAIDIRINKKVSNNQGTLEFAEIYCCLECGVKRGFGATHYTFSSEIDELEEDMLECYDDICMGDEELLVAIYNRIKVRHPNISNEEMLQYISAALHNMETKPITLERHKKRILRLNLTPEFNNWDKKSVIHYGDSL